MDNMSFVPHTNWENKTSGAVTKTKEIPCLTGKGMPTTSTIGAVGCLYMDTDSGAVYKCTAASDGVYTWVDALDSAEMKRVIEAYLEANPPADGEDGGHYTPIVTQPTADTMKVEFAPSKAGMAAVKPVTVKLPSGGSDSGENVALDNTLTVEGKAADAKAVGDALAGKVAGVGITTIMAITQEDYDELVMLGQVDETTLYIIKPKSEDGPDMTMIPVLRSDGVAYIDLGIAPIDGAWYEVCFRGINVGQRGIFGNRFTKVAGAGGELEKTWVSGYYNDSAYATFNGGTTDLSKKHTFAVSSTALTLDGDIVTDLTAGTNTIVTKMLLFSTNNSTEKNGMYVTAPCAIDLFYLRIWSGENKLLHNYVPAQDSEGVACIYDTVDKAYLYNAAESGAFEYREELEEA